MYAAALLRRGVFWLSVSWSYQLLHIVKVIPKPKQLKFSPLWTLMSPRIVIGDLGSVTNGLRAFRE